MIIYLSFTNMMVLFTYLLDAQDSIIYISAVRPE